MKVFITAVLLIILTACGPKEPQRPSPYQVGDNVRIKSSEICGTVSSYRYSSYNDYVYWVHYVTQDGPEVTRHSENILERCE